MAVCVNCLIVLRPNVDLNEYLAIELNPDLVAITEGWIEREVTSDDRLCQACVNLIIREADNIHEHHVESNRQYGHVCVCVSCGISLGRSTGRRRHRLHAGSSERIYIENEIFPRQVPVEAWSCHACWMQAYNNLGQAQSEPVMEIRIPENQEVIFGEGNPNPLSSSVTTTAVPSSETDSWIDVMNVPNLPNVPTENREDIELATYSRTPNTSNHCFLPDCNFLERLRVPNYLRRAILAQYKLYITTNARVCANHITLFNWDILNDYEFSKTFSASQIEDMLNLLKKGESESVVDFENIQRVNDHLFQYWTGLTILHFVSLYNSVPQLENLFRKSKTALGLYLVKLRTGEPIKRISSLFLLSTGTVSTYLRKVRNCLLENYVPLHLGIGHMTREDHSARNLLIPQGLFGTDTNNPIAIMDGTYIYLQKSSNYLFQKLTYSLHKYRNLVKPFLIVTCDGHILDVSGPHAATQSDAEIVKKLFENSNSPLRSYFQQNDVFILDRGFRDAIDLLEGLGYSVQKPESLSVGETQLSTIKANKSRCVTLCRWVVEVVNGRFKRDFKIFRGEYFNVASKNLMPDFKIAAAILNNFHPVLTDHSQAQQILDRARARLNLPNDLATYVIEHRLNRHSANFVNINAQLPQLNVFPIMEISDLILFALGIYQIKQAKSYYGEHIRHNGTFIIEVDTNLQEQSNNNLLLRGRIRSRHVSNRKYFTYILLDINAANWSQRIAGYYCSCIVGKRTVGCCAHVMAIVWYLGWARHQEVPILPPALFLDGIIVRDVDDEE